MFKHLIVATALILISTAAFSQTIKGLNDELAAAPPAALVLNQTMSDTTDENIKIAKERKVYTDDAQQKLAALQVKIDAELVKFAPIKQQHDADNANYIAQCTGRSLPQPEYDRCVTWQGRLNAEKAEWEAYKAEWNRVNTDPVNAVIAQQNARIAQIDAQVKANFQRFLDAQASFSVLKKRVDQIITQLKRMCEPQARPLDGESFTSAEKAKYCVGIDWDGLRRTLPPMYRYQGTGGAAPN